MESIKRYFKRVDSEIANVNDAQTNSIDTYKIITIAKSENNPFLIHDSDENGQLNSGSLIQLLDVRCRTDLLKDLLDLHAESKMNNMISEICRASDILKEKRIFSNFDPYCNFMLGPNTTSNDIKNIIQKTLSCDLDDNCDRYDFSNLVNPYGLEKIVFTGGGTKGKIYVGAALGLLATGQIFYINQFIGTSIGGLSALIFSCVTPSGYEYQKIKSMSLKNILNDKILFNRYQKATEFAATRMAEQKIESFYEFPECSTFYGMWSMASKIINDNGLYNPSKSGFEVWYSLVCQRICQIMNNDLDKYIIVRDENNKIIRFKNYEPHRYDNDFDFD